MASILQRLFPHTLFLSDYLMETMLAMLPPGEEDGVLFKMLYVTKVPSKVRSHVMAGGMSLSSREMASLADDLWFGASSTAW